MENNIQSFKEDEELSKNISETYISMYSTLCEMSTESIKKIPNINRKIDSVMQHFIEVEDYRKCSILKKISESLVK
jgi:hypothetical protein